MGELESLDDVLLFQWTERALLAEFHGALQLQQCFLEVNKPLLPANIGVVHWISLCLKDVVCYTLFNLFLNRNFDNGA